MAAVEVRNGYKYYGSSSNPKIILNYLNMNVKQGSIYGLLGASGCGKTTLLSCIVGQKQLNRGEISVLGLTPGAPGSGIPGSRIGFMPQEVALVQEMTVKEIIYYFGRIYGLTDEKIREKFKILRDLLDLPSPKRPLKNCSGGQQRRVSFACAIIHDPELLILDEPTVGLDPILREKIWQFLVETTRNGKMAVIITTHYIEEAKDANCIGLMRNGILLAEDSPRNILTKFQCSSIEEAFLSLCQKQGDLDFINVQNKAQNNSVVPAMHLPEIIDTGSLPEKCEEKVGYGSYNNNNNIVSNNNYYSESNDNQKKVFFTTKGRIKALMTKNFVQLFRQPSGIIFLLLFPIIQLSCFYLAIGKTPKDLKLGIVNEEISNFETCFDINLQTVYYQNETCWFDKVSCRYITQLGDDVLIRSYYNNLEEVNQAAKKTDIVGYISFPTNFSEALTMILENGQYAEEYAFDNSKLSVQIDMTDQQVAFFVERKLRDSYVKFLQSILEDCNLPAKLGNIPVTFEEPIYGSFDIEFQQYSAPGVIMTMVFFLATLMTAAVFISERTDGVWNRTLVAGVSALEMLWAHLLTQFLLVAVQSFEIIMFIGVVFDTYNKGDTFTLISLLTLTAFCGMLFGLLVSVFCKTHTEANFVSTGAFYPMIILCGLLWPLEGMPKGLQDVVKFFPFTIPTRAARNIIEKGWAISNSQVYDGFLVMTAWIIIFFSLCLLGLKRKA